MHITCTLGQAWFCKTDLCRRGCIVQPDIINFEGVPVTMDLFSLRKPWLVVIYDEHLVYFKKVI